VNFVVGELRAQSGKLLKQSGTNNGGAIFSNAVNIAIKILCCNIYAKK